MEVARELKSASRDTRDYYADDGGEIDETFMMEEVEIDTSTDLRPTDGPPGPSNHENRFSNPRASAYSESAQQGICPTVEIDTVTDLRPTHDPPGSPNHADSFANPHASRSSESDQKAQRRLSPNDNISATSSLHTKEAVTDHYGVDTHHLRPPTISPSPTPSSNLIATPNNDFPRASFADAHRYFIVEGNWRYLFGTAFSWSVLDFAFYGLGFSSPAIVRNIWSGANAPQESVYQSLLDNGTHSLVLVSIGTMLGAGIMIKAIKHWSPKSIQLWGFVALGILFLVIGSAFTKLLSSSFEGILIVLYAICQFSFNLGPNSTTFIVSLHSRVKVGS
jgi:PHS family inorganic phosphate transporter-like MFS transporter